MKEINVLFVPAPPEAEKIGIEVFEKKILVNRVRGGQKRVSSSDSILKLEKREQRGEWF